MYFSSNNNSSSNGTLSSFQKTLNTLKYLKNQSIKNSNSIDKQYINTSINNNNNNPNLQKIMNPNFNNNTSNYKANIYDANDNLTELDNFLFNKILESNPSLYKDIFNKNELDLSKIKFDNSRNSSMIKTPTFSSYTISDGNNISHNNTYLLNNNEKILCNPSLDQILVSKNNRLDIGSNNSTLFNANTNTFSKFYSNHQDLNIIYEENKYENNDKDEINFEE